MIGGAIMVDNTIKSIIEDLHDRDEFLDPEEILKMYNLEDDEYLDDMYDAFPHVYVNRD